MSVPPVLEIENLTAFHGQRRVLDGVDLSVAAGSLHVLVGPNGAGKSSLLASVLGRLEFTGRIRMHWRGAGRIGWVPQSFAVDRTLPVTVEDFLALTRQRRPVALGIARATRRHVADLLARVGLSGFARRPLGALSGGEQQKVLLANAIDPVPELLLLDEPSSGLDPASVNALETLLRTLTRDESTAVLMVSHDIGQARRIADRVTALDGTGFRTGAPAQILHDVAGLVPAGGAATGVR